MSSSGAATLNVSSPAPFLEGRSEKLFPLAISGLFISGTCRLDGIPTRLPLLDLCDQFSP